MHRTLLILLATAVVVSCGNPSTDEAPASDTTSTVRPAPLPAPVDPAVATRPPDESIAEGIRERFEVMGGMKDVTVAVDSGVAKLGGTVRMEDRIPTATDVAREMGAAEVDNSIVVRR